MTPEQKIKREILLEAAKEPEFDFGPLETPEQVKMAYDKLIGADAHQEYEDAFRYGECVTNIPPDEIGGYASRSVAMKCQDGTWVGWTYYHAGGKHGYPQSIEWMPYAYFLTCVEEERLAPVQIRTFTKVGNPKETGRVVEIKE